MAIVTLMTDFGISSPYVAEMKGVILSICATTNIVDLTHTIAAQNIVVGAYVWKRATRTFPAGVIHVAVVDPGVGSERRIVAVRCGGSIFIAPDNGLLGLIVDSVTPDRIIELDDPAFWRDTVSATFHGRDIMAPVAAYLSQGVAMEELGSPCPSVKTTSLPTVVASSTGCLAFVLWIDGFGNVITNVRQSDLPPDFTADSLGLRCGDVVIDRYVSHYAEAPVGELVALIDSAGMLELSVVGGSAASRLRARQGESLELTWLT